MGKLMIVASLLAGLGGCGSKDKFDEVLGEMSNFKDKMCACADQACVDKVQDEWKTYRKGMKEKVGKDAKPNETQDKKGRELDDEMRKCRHKYEATSGGVGSGSGSGSGAPAQAPATP